MSMWTSNSATIAMMLTFLEAILVQLERFNQEALKRRKMGDGMENGGNDMVMEENVGSAG